ncbi:TMEM138 [Acanthosepion pharaonis]|uniref:Transmembrane protein 138 n=1 Tax=Acanthosepion pharaonis TaxID=158019 RepID=A0A812BWS8_ACAPH|nr:TMEM138 [Sepia pharaonis]
MINQLCACRFYAAMLLTRYKAILFLQYVLLVADFFFNISVELLRMENVVLLIVYILQAIGIVFALIVVFLLFFYTYIFQAGLVSILVKKFRVSITVTFVYLVLCVTLHGWALKLRWDNPQAYIWDVKGIQILYIFQRCSAILYYYFYKRTALKLGDPKFYQESEWLRDEFEKRR